jgi:hypothetical protein
LDLGNTRGSVEVLVAPVSDATFDQALSESTYCRPRWRKASPTRHIAFYRVSPISAITHIAEVVDVSANSSGTQVFRLSGLKKLQKPIPRGRPQVGIQSYKYTTIERLLSAKNIDEL